MITARRLKRNVKRFLIPFETALLWVLGPLGLAAYWLLHGAVHGVRYAGTLLTHLRF
jgi:hypothetical protein